MTTSPVRLFTHPSNWEGHGPEIGSTRFPYRRVVGIKARGQATVWAAGNPTLIPATHYDYDPSTAVINTISGTEKFTGRLLGFFQRYFGAEAVIGAGYTCHDFAAWMEGSFSDDDIVATDLPIEVQQSPNAKNTQAALSRVSCGQIVNSGIALGRAASWGEVVRSESGDNAQVFHSVVGLGTDTNDYIQVIAAYGHMGIASYSEMNGLYGAVNATHLFTDPTHV